MRSFYGLLDAMVLIKSIRLRVNDWNKGMRVGVEGYHSYLNGRGGDP
jgi:hypothetical protein